MTPFLNLPPADVIAAALAAFWSDHDEKQKIINAK